MSLGIAPVWRVRYHGTGAFGISVIPRSPSRWSRAPSAQLQLSCRWMRAASEAAGKPNLSEMTLSHGEKWTDNTADRTTHDVTTNAAEKSAAAQAPAEEREQTDGIKWAFDALPHTTPNSNIHSGLSSPSSTSTLGEGWNSTFSRFRTVKTVKSQPEWSSGQEGRGRDNQSTTKHDQVAPPARTRKVNEKFRIYQSDSVLVAPMIKYSHTRETMCSLNRYHRGLKRQQHLEAIREIKRGPLTNWRTILDVLRRRTRHVNGPWQKYGRKISISKQLAEVLLYRPDYTIWDINERTRCHIELRWSPDQIAEGPQTRPCLLLSGDGEALEFAVDEIILLARASGGKLSIEERVNGNMSERDTPEIISQTAESEERVWYSSNKFQRPSNVPAFVLHGKFEDIPVPKEWTHQTFEAYVGAISKAKLPPRLVSRFYGSSVAAYDAAFCLLLKTFENPAASQSLSTRAFKVALQTMEVHGHPFRQYARELFDIMCRLQVPVDTGVFNVLLSGTVNAKDLRNFDNIISMMIRHSCIPNTETWVLVLQLIENLDVRRHIIKLMHLCGLLIDPDAARRLARALVVFDVRHHHLTWKGLQHFLEHQEATYTKNWTSLDIMNKLLSELGKLGYLEESCQLLNIMVEAYSIRPSTLSIKTVVYHARCQRRMETVISALRVAHRHKIPLDEDTYHEIFHLFNTMRKSNMQGLVWLVACIEGKTSWPMRNRVSSLVTLPGEPTLVGKTPSIKNPGGAAPIYTLPGFHQESHIPALRKLKDPRLRGTTIEARLYHKYKDWHIIDAPLHELLEQAWVVDNDIYAMIRKVKQQSQQQHQQGASNRSEDMSSEAVGHPTPTTTAPAHRIVNRIGIPLTIGRKVDDAYGIRRWQRVTLPIFITHVASEPTPAENNAPIDKQPLKEEQKRTK